MHFDIVICGKQACHFGGARNVLNKGRFFQHFGQILVNQGKRTRMRRLYTFEIAI